MLLNVKFNTASEIKEICGYKNKNIREIEELFQTNIGISGDNIYVNSTEDLDVDKLERLFKILICMVDLSNNIQAKDIIYVKSVVDRNLDEEYIEFLRTRKPICYTNTNKPIYAKTLRQHEYLKMLDDKDLIFSIGSAGTGKTYLAVCYAVRELKKNNVDKIILTRPAVEAGESLGFLPGDLKEKVDPYLTPLYDALHDLLGIETTNAYIERGIIEIAPLAYMRGRTLDKSVIILDEAQNATIAQLKMFLTRLGFASKMVLTGDISQIDLPSNKKSGLRICSDLLSDLEEVSTCVFESEDVVRHPLVSKIIDKFEKIGE